jgi:acetyltransferase-like isoleucine patch superfamily enzyme
MANLIVRTFQSIGEGTVREKLKTRRAMLRAHAWRRAESILWYMGNSSWQCRWKAAILRRFGATVGSRLYMERAVIVRGPDGLQMGSDCAVSAFTVLTCSGGLTIGDHVMVGYGCRVLTANHRVLPAGRHFRYSGHETAPVVLKSGCWLGTNVVVLPGVTVGEGAVAAAGAVVTRDVPDNTYVGGVPAKVIGYREGYSVPHAESGDPNSGRDSPD